MGRGSGFEHEVKVMAPEGFQLPVFGGFQELSEVTVTLEATYWDTAALHLTGWGHSLRRRTASDGSERGWTLKLSGQGSKFALRREVQFDSDAPTPPAAAIDVLRGLIGRAPLTPVAVLTTRRRARRLRHIESGSTIEVADDEVASRIGGHEGPVFREIEVEAVDGDDAVLRRAAKLLRKAGADVADQTPKIARALDHAAAPAPFAIPATVGELVRVAIAEGARQLQAHDPAIRLAGEAEDIHKARVATRRLRSDLKTLGRFCDGFRIDGLRRELAWLGDVLGHVRDADVLRVNLEARAAALPDVDPTALAGLQLRLTSERSQALATLLDVMRSSRYAGLLADLTRLAAEPPLRPDVDCDAPSVPAARAVTRQAFRRVRDRVEQLPAGAPTEELHEVRKAAKRARYAAELVAPVAGGRTDALAERLTDLQDALGATQDAVVAVCWLQEAAPATGDTGQAYLAGRLAQSFQHDIDQPTAWLDAWGRAAAAKHRRWLR